MRLDAAGALVDHQIGNGLTIPANNDGFVIFLQLRQEAGEMGLRFMNIYSFHSEPRLVHLVHIVNR